MRILDITTALIKFILDKPAEVCLKCKNLYIDKDTKSIHYSSKYCCKIHKIRDEYYYIKGIVSYWDCSVIRGRNIILNQYCRNYKQ